MAYYEHVKFFTANMMAGHYPFWEPNRDGGSSFELFSRRIGSYNPFFWVISLLCRACVPFNAAYLGFLAGYFFLGSILFYRTLRLFFGRSITSYVGYTLFVYSALGLQVFFSYLVYLVTPMMGFLYFICAFLRRPKRIYFLGAVFSFCILMQTYVPFYFLFVVLVALILSVVLYFDVLNELMGTIGHFARSQKWVVLFSLLAISVSVLQGWHLHEGFTKSGFSMPARHSGSTDSNQLTVSTDKIIEGGFRPLAVVEDSLRDVQDFALSRYYLPVFLVVPFLLGQFFPLKRRYVFWMVSGTVCLLLSLSDTMRGYSLIYQWVYFCKYFRNYEHFFFIAVIPFVVLAACELLHQVLYGRLLKGAEKIAMAVFSCLVHLGLIWHIVYLNGSFTWTCVVLAASAVFWAVFFIMDRKLPAVLTAVVCLSLIILPSLEAFWYADKNAENRNFLYRYESGVEGAVIKYVDPSVRPAVPKNGPAVFPKGPADSACNHTVISLYLNNVESRVPSRIFEDMLYRAAFYENTEVVSDHAFSPSVLARRWLEGRGAAFIDRDDGLERPASGAGEENRIVKASRDNIKDFSSNSDRLSFTVDLDRPEFLVYFEAYAPEWRGWIDGTERHIYRANEAFIGVWIPAGKHTVILRYGRFIDRLGVWFGLLFFTGFLGWLLVEAKG